MQLTYFDLAVIVVLVLFALRGAFRGFIAEMAGLVGFAAGIGLALAFSPQVSDLLAGLIAPSATMAVAMVSLFIVGMLLVGIVAKILQSVLEFAFAGWIDGLLGIVGGLIKGAFVCCILSYVAVLLVPQFDAVKNSETIPYFMSVIQELTNNTTLKEWLPS